MKHKFYSYAVIAALITGSMLTGCKSPEEKVDAANTKMEDAKQNLADTQKKAAEDTQKAADAEAWRVYKADSEMRIKENEATINTMKSNMKMAGKKVDAAYAKSIDALEQKNKDMQMRINDYDKTHGDWESFKREFGHDMDGLGSALKDLTVNNKK